MAVNSIYKLALEGRGPQDQELVNTLYYKALTGTVFDTQAEDLIQAFMNETALPESFTNLFHSSCSFTGISVRGITDPTEGADDLFDTPIPGQNTGQCLPPFTSCVVTFTTGKIGRSYRGRNFIWPTSEANQDAGFLISGYIDAVSDYADDIRSIGDGIVAAVYQQVVWSPTLGVATPVTGATPRAALHVQRRRTSGVGA